MHAAAAGRSTLGIPQGVAQKFVADSHGQKVSKLPMHVKKTPRERVASALAGDK